MTVMSNRSRSYRPGNWARLLLVGDWKATLHGSQRHEIIVKTAVDGLLQRREVVSVSASKALLRNTVELRSKSRTIGLSAMPANGAEELAPGIVALMLTRIDCVTSIMLSGNGAARQRRRTGKNA